MLHCRTMPANIPSSDPVVEAFLARWDGTEQAERANYVAFLNELCAIIGARRQIARGERTAPLVDATRLGAELADAMLKTAAQHEAPRD